MPRVCVFECRTGGLKLHVFPIHDATRFRTWVEIVSRNMGTPADCDYYRRKRICDKHFADKHKVANNRVSNNAVPTLYLDGKSSEIERREFSPPQQPTTQTDQIPCQSETTLSAAVIEMDHDYCRPMVILSSKENLSTNYQSSTVSAAVIEMDHDYSEPMVIHSSKKKISTKYSVNVMKPSVVSHLPTIKRQVKNLKREVSRLRKKGSSFKTRLQNAEKLNNNMALKRVTKNMTYASKLFTELQFRETTKKVKGRRFKMEEKVLALSLYKRSPRMYPLLSKFFTLPSAKTLKQQLSKIKLKEGINPIILNEIKNSVKKMDVKDRLCTLIFDEMSLSPQLHYDAGKDEIIGLTSEGKIADHALVFMIKAINLKYKQPVAYHFTNCLKKLVLKNMIKDVIKALQRTGLNIICTVCDQSTTNVSAINELIKETKRIYLKNGEEYKFDHFIVNNKHVIPLYDVPHLLKGLRNNLLNKTMRYIDYDDENKEKIVKWEYLEKLYIADKSFGELRCLQKITEEHINPEKIRKMKVKLATQIFSRSVAVATEHLSARNLIPNECRMLIPVFLLLDNLFDSFNVSTYHVPNGKKYMGAVKKKSPHHALWHKAKKTLKSVRFVEFKHIKNKVQLIERNTPSVNNFIKTIEGMEVLYKILSEKYLLNAVLTRNFNQDPVENFFGSIRSLGVRNTAPNCVNFIGAYKSLLLNNFSSSHSLKSNCEKDDNNFLQSLDFFVNQGASTTTSNAPIEERYELNDSILNNNIIYEQDHGQRNYVCGWVLSRCLRYVSKSCKTCKSYLTGSSANKSNAFIKIKEYSINNQWLCYPSDELVEYFHELQNIIEGFLIQNVCQTNLKGKIIAFADLLARNPFTKCDLHKRKIKEFFDTKTINIIIYSWCRSINRILSGKLTYSGYDLTKLKAQLYHDKFKHFKCKK